MAGFVKVAGKDDIPVGSAKSFSLGDDDIIVAHTEKGFFAFQDECTHDGAPFDEDELDGCQITCPRHGATFDVTTGEVTGPPALISLYMYELKVDGDDILVNLG